MKLIRTSPFWSFGIALLALIFIGWGTSLVWNVTHHRQGVSERVVLIAQLTSLEKIIRSFEQSLYRDRAEYTPDRGHSYWQKEYADYVTTRNSIRRSRESVIRNLAPTLDEVDTLVQRLGNLYHATLANQPVIPSKSEQELAFFYESNKTIDLIKNAITESRAELAEISEALSQDWYSLNLLVLVSCLMAIMVAFILHVYQKDIQKRKGVETALHRITAEFRAMFKSIPDAVVFTDMKHEILMVNPAFTDLFGYHPEEVIGRERRLFFAKNTKKALSLSTKNNNDPRKYEVDCVKKSGANFISEVVDAVVLQDGEAFGIFSIVRDITLQKEAEETLSAAHEKLEVWVNERTEDLLRANEEVKRFAYIVSHDLRAPLVNIKGFSGELQQSVNELNKTLGEAMENMTNDQRQAIKGILEEDIPEALQFINSGASRMGHLIDAVLKLSRLGRRELRFRKIDVQEMVTEILDSLAHQIESSHIEMNVGKLPPVVADRTSLEQIIGNILVNAIHYLLPERSGKISVSARTKKQEVEFTIRDNGRGISDEDMSKVFEPFSRAGRQNVPGEGMGLAYVQTLVRRHGGRIWCESTLGEGTAFIFTLSRQPMEQ